MIKKLDDFEKDVLAAYEKRANSSLLHLQKPAGQIQARALEAGIPYQTFIASVLRKYTAGRLFEKPSRLTARATGCADKRRAD
ncbi:MAG: hypothetical protein EPO43_08960 [Rugosibacter sp.]|nr:MAG: hypothetical protein EPO43_08960 [Rugosibacter sp.]